MKRLILLIGASLLAGLPAAADEADRVVDGLQRWLDGTRDLQAEFRQSLLSGALGAGEEERGVLLLQRPGRMRWEYEDPEHKVAIIDRGRTLLYLAEDRQMILGRLEGDGDLLPRLLGAERPLRELFAFGLEATPELGGEGSWRLRLRPRTQTEAVQSVLLTLDGDSYAILAARVLDPAGNSVLYEFSDQRRNRGIEGSPFEFAPPAGTEILGAADG